ncbi:hypothetical protein ACSBR2_008912 [Camellia fascicularis]
MHFILFQNAFEIAFFFWIWLQYGFDSCIMGHVRFIIHRLVIGVFVQVLCSYSTLPLYAIVTQSNCGVSVLDFTPRLEGGRPQIHLLQLEVLEAEKPAIG